MFCVDKRVVFLHCGSKYSNIRFIIVRLTMQSLEMYIATFRLFTGAIAIYNSSDYIVPQTIIQCYIC